MYEYKALITKVHGSDLFDICVDMGLNTHKVAKVKTKDFKGPHLESGREEKERAKKARKRAKEILENKWVTIKTYKAEDEEHVKENIKYLVEVTLPDGRLYSDVMKEEDLARFE